jgi:hypothetical protein
MSERRSRACRHLSHFSVQEHDARLDWLSILPESNFAGSMKQHENLGSISLSLGLPPFASAWFLSIGLSAFF